MCFRDPQAIIQYFDFDAKKGKVKQADNKKNNNWGK